MNGMLMLRETLKKSDRQPLGKSQKTRRTIWKSGIIFIALVLLTFYIIFKGSNAEELARIMKNSNKWFILCGFLCVAAYLCADAVNIRRMLRGLGYKTTFSEGLKYSGTGFFFSMITPSSTGGQPMQIFYMFYDDVHISHATVTLMMDLISYELITIGFAVTGIITQHGIVFRAPAATKVLIITGFAVNGLLLLFLIFAVFAPIISEKIVMGVVGKLKRFKFAKRFDLENRAREQLSEYQATGKIIGQDIPMLIKVLMTTFVQILALYATTYFAFGALHITGYSFFTVVTLQAVVSVGMSFIPLPGSVGANEGGFLYVFGVIVPSALLEPALILSRGISFYIMLGAAGLIVAYNYFRGNLIPDKAERKDYYNRKHMYGSTGGKLEDPDKEKSGGA
ncbi:MAG: lysylphosphatidylglycerol synthase transmembrane domain-containing protein [Anaerovoracaceae bacterium]|nr:lysylphosphatidylglycerol synthase transmembrane domain-containing protein [Anaerovoracaceae bacterium]